MRVIQINHIEVNGKLYSYSWLDFSTYMRLTIRLDGKVVGQRNLDLRVDRGLNMIRYIIKRMEVGYGKKLRKLNN